MYVYNITCHCLVKRLSYDSDDSAITCILAGQNLGQNLIEVSWVNQDPIEFIK